MIKSFFISFVAFVIFDFIWLGYVVAGFNVRQLAAIGRIENGKFDVLYAPAVLVYVLLALAVTFFVLPVCGPDSSWWRSFLYGSLMGLVIYGVYDMTNLSILKDYPLKFAAADIAWGVFVCGAVSALANRFAGPS